MHICIEISDRGTSKNIITILTQEGAIWLINKKYEKNAKYFIQEITSQFFSMFFSLTVDI